MKPGTRIGQYEIVGHLGAGGMGEVYRARDSKLDREVALKVLPASMADDADSLARLEREAKSLAALNHPNIAHVYGLEQADSAVIVMELVEGEDLAERLAGGPLPLQDALPIARQIAEALEAAHARGIVHRDLKPANVKITPEGRVKVLDFGLAKPTEHAARTGGDVTESPTLMMTAATPGMVMGTAAYMSPEQAKGLPVDRRADIWAYGAVLFELLTGRRLFDGDDLTEVLAAVISTEPDLTPLPRSTPRWLRDLIERCLRRDVALRLPDIGVARIAILEAADGDGEPEVMPPAGLSRWAWVAAALIVGMALGAGTASRLGGPSSAPGSLPTIYAELVLDPPPMPDVSLAISPDGQRIAYNGGDDTRRVMIYLRDLGTGMTTALPGTENGFSPAFSPDSGSVAFFAGGKLWVTVIGGSLPKAVTPASGTAEGIVWLADDTLIYSTSGYRMLQRVAATGGSPSEVPARFPDAPNLRLVGPVALPDPDHLLVTFLTSVGDGARVGVLSLVDGTLAEVASGSDPRFIAPSILLFMQRRTLVAAPFDPQTRTLMAVERQLELPGVALVTTTSSAGDIAVAGTLASGRALYPMGDLEPRDLVWVDRDGQQTRTDFIFDEDRNLSVGANGAIGAALSPDGKRVALVIGRAPVVISLDDPERRRTLPAPGSTIAYASWAPSGEDISLLGNLAGTFHGYLIAASGTGQPREISSIPQSIPLSFFPDGNSLLGYVVTPDAGRDLWVFGLDGNDVPVLQTPANERAPQVAPDGRAFVYVSDTSGEDRIYVRLYPDVGRAWPLSDDGATAPRWSRDGREVYFLQDSRMMAVEIDLADGVRIGTPVALFDASGYEQDPFSIAMYDVAADGRFLMVRRGIGVRNWRFIQNWSTALGEQVPAPR